MDSFQHLDISVDCADYRPAVLSILAAIRPQWKEEDICTTEMTRGFCGNFLVKCCATEGAADDDNEEKVIIKMFGDKYPFHRDSEAYIMRKLSEKSIISPVYCRFKNGMAYQYAPGNVLKREQLYDAKFLRLIALKMHAVHQLDVKEYFKQLGRMSFFDVARNMYSKWKVPDFKDEQKRLRYEECLPSKAQLDLFMKEWEESYADLENRYPPVFCHMDVHDQNVIYDSKTAISYVTDSIALVDWEVCDVSVEIMDVAVLITRTPHTGVFTDSASMKKWLKVYLSTHPVHCQQPLSPDILQKWYRDCVQACCVIVFQMVVHFISNITNPPNHLDFLELSIMIYKRYISYKEELEMLDAE